jgi:tRNA dimethylallyltransferase
VDPEGQSPPPLIVLAGPTASGKSTLALELAELFGGTIVNADSLQVYRDLPILSAQPDPPAKERVPHRLYGYLDAAERGSVGRWRDLAVTEIAAVHRAGGLPFVVGGTGLYLRALQHGMVVIPAIPPAIRAEAEELCRALGTGEFRERLAELDPVAATRFSDRQRLVRAYEVVRTTGMPIGEWQKEKPEMAPYRFRTILMLPPRAALYAACDARLLAMLAAGGLDEAKALAARGLSPELPAMKALGIPDLLRHLRGEVGLDQAITAAQRATRRYAKRQITWFRHQLTPDLVLTEQFSESLLRCSRHFIDQFLLTGKS